ncbi:ATP-binding protein [Streptomyces sp. NPDC059070]|uniref:ATP-binding protein n=1 Tax=unclassified Streptomyces TaxID=2593676 RepID=UPI0034E2D2C8
MKQSAVKTLGTAAVGVAFAAAAAGSAAAAPAAAGLPELPVLSGVTKKLPMGAAESLTAGQNALGKGASAVPAGATDPVGGLLGGLPVGGLGGGLPLGG